LLQEYDLEQLKTIPPDTIGDALEQSKIVKFTQCPIELPDPETLTTLRTELPRQLKLKNISYHPEADRVTGLDDQSPIKDLAHETLSEFRNRVTHFLETVMPALATGINAGTCSFRPLQEQGRKLKPHASNELVHVDAGAYGATNGDRILRFFVNVNPDVDRIWASKGAFPDLFQKYAKEAGLFENLKPSLERGAMGQLRTAMLKGLAGVGLPLAPMLDSSPYDRVMRKFHNYMKDTPEFQEAMETHETFTFEPYTSWMVLTDTVSHASVSGQHALVYTGLLRLDSCRHPELAPFNIVKSAVETPSN